jgi:hypothetical protein
MRCDSWASLLALTLASPYLGHEPKVRVVTIKPSRKCKNPSTISYNTYGFEVKLMLEFMSAAHEII